MTFRAMHLLHALVLLAPLAVALGCDGKTVNGVGHKCKKSKECGDVADLGKNQVLFCVNGECSGESQSGSNSVSSGLSGPHSKGVVHP